MLTAALAKRGEAARVAHFSPHDLRKTYASGLIDLSGDISTVSRLLGHSSIDTTAIYDRRGETAKRKVADSLGLDSYRLRQPQKPFPFQLRQTPKCVAPPRGGNRPTIDLDTIVRNVARRADKVVKASCLFAGFSSASTRMECASACPLRYTHAPRIGQNPNGNAPPNTNRHRLNKCCISRKC
ncbi:MAG: tyrosine-type recombinase/integrase [Pyrinomonadaceae bacterium]